MLCSFSGGKAGGEGGPEWDPQTLLLSAAGFYTEASSSVSGRQTSQTDLGSAELWVCPDIFRMSPLVAPWAGEVNSCLHRHIKSCNCKAEVESFLK